MRDVAARAAPAASVADSTTIHASPPVSLAADRARFDDRRGEPLLLVQPEAQRDVRRALDAIDADFAVALGGVRVARREKRAGIVDGKIQRGARAKLAHIHIAAERPRRPRDELAVFGPRNSHHAAEWPQRHDGRARATG